MYKQLKRMSVYRDFVGELKVIYTRTSMLSIFIRTSNDAADFIRPYFDEVMDDHEEVKLIHINRSNGIVNVDNVSVGGDSSSLVPITKIVRNALYIKTTAVIMVHNHPSGNLNPSDMDINFSKRLEDAFKIVDIDFMDSIIITREGFYSLSDNGRC